MKADPRDLLTALLDACRCGLVTQPRAAKLLGIRKEEFAELSDLRLGIDGWERAAWRYFEERFNYRFPECDPRCATGKARAYEGTPRDIYATEPSPRDCQLLEPPQRRTLRELVPRAVKPDAEVSRYLRTHRVPMWKRFPDETELTGPETVPNL